MQRYTKEAEALEKKSSSLLPLFRSLQAKLARKLDKLVRVAIITCVVCVVHIAYLRMVPPRLVILLMLWMRRKASPSLALSK